MPNTTAGDPPNFAPIPDSPYPPYYNSSFNNPLYTTITDDTLQKALLGSLKSVGSDLATLETLKRLLFGHIKFTRGLAVYEPTDTDKAEVWKDGGHQVFVSVSWLACIEWALDQPYIKLEE